MKSMVSDAIKKQGINRNSHQDGMILNNNYCFYSALTSVYLIKKFSS